MALTTNINYLQPSGFRLIADRRRFGNLTFFAQTVNHPSLSTNAAEMPFRQYQSVPQVGDTFTYSELTMNVILDEDMASYFEILDWMKSNVTEVIKDADDDDSTKCDLTLTILTSKNNINKSIRYIDAFPTDIGNVTMEASVSDTQVLTVPISFRFTYFELVT